MNFSQPSPLMLRVDSHGKLSPPQPDDLNDKTKRPHKIELVETPDCTSIDTTIPEDEIRAMNEKKKSYLERVTEAREKQEKEEDGSDTEVESRTPEEYIDEVFKPVFDTAEDNNSTNATAVEE